MSRLFQTISIVLLAAGASLAQPPIRGDANSDAKVDISDPIFVLGYLFTGGEAPGCLPAADANADRKVDISDAVAALTYLFAGQGALPPLTAEEAAECGVALPVIVRTGRLIDVLEPGHDIDGRADELSDRTIRLRDFSYNGLGDPQVVVRLTVRSFDAEGIIISPDLRRDEPYAKETLVFPLPDGVSTEDFAYVAIWCDAVPLTFAYASLRATP